MTNFENVPSRHDLLRDDAYFTLRSKVPHGEYDCTAASVFFDEHDWEPLDRHGFEPYAYTDVFIDRDTYIDVEDGHKYVHVVCTDDWESALEDRESFPVGTRVRLHRRAYFLDEDLTLVRVMTDIRYIAIDEPEGSEAVDKSSLSLNEG